MTKVGNGITIQFRDGYTTPVVVKDLNPIGIVGPGGDLPKEGPHLYIHKRVNQYRTDIIWYVNGKLRRRKVLLHNKHIRA
jgi:hypothetical protein